MAKVQVTLDAAKLRNLISNREYTNKAGELVKLQEVKFELIEVKEPKTIVTKDTYRIDKTHFAAAIQTKEERDSKAETGYIGEGFTTIWLNNTATAEPAQQQNSTVAPKEDDLPF
jgi:hypothetical protein